jgi:hypothetical protein
VSQKGSGRLVFSKSEEEKMHTVASQLAAISLLALFVVTGVADEHKIPLKKLPKKVIAAVKKNYPDWELTGAEKETKGKKVFYEVKLSSKGKKIEVLLTPKGKIVEVEEAIDLKDLPKVVSDTLKAKYPKATPLGAEKVFKKGKLVAYEVAVKTGNKKGEVVFDTKGKVVKVEGLDQKKEKKQE